jgi:hypothetical protein
VRISSETRGIKNLTKINLPRSTRDFDQTEIAKL